MSDGLSVHCVDTTDVVAVDTTHVLAAHTKDVLSADATDVMSATGGAQVLLFFVFWKMGYWIFDIPKNNTKMWFSMFLKKDSFFLGNCPCEGACQRSPKLLRIPGLCCVQT